MTTGDLNLIETGPGTLPCAAAGAKSRRLLDLLRPRQVFHLIAILLPPIAYFAFVVRDSVDAIVEDEWNATVPVIHAALHHSLTFSLLWMQHNENRMLVPNIVFVLFGRFDHYDTRSIVLLSAALYCVSYWLLVRLWRTRLGRPSSAGAAAAMLVGFVWFSFEDWENALWGFQFAWFLITFLLLVLLVSLNGSKMRPWHVGAAVVAAVVASFTSLQGLFLWPIGLLCLLWRYRKTEHRVGYEFSWISIAVLTILTYFRGYSVSTGGNISFALRHPAETAQYFFSAIGNIFPVNGGHLAVTQTAGVVIFAVATLVSIQVVRHREDWRLPVPIGLILFGILFDISIAIGRLYLGVPQALSSRYTMPNLLIVAGIAVYFLSPSTAAPEIAVHLHTRWARPNLNALPVVLVIAALVAQVILSDHYGWDAGRSEQQSLQIAARLEVNLTRVPGIEQSQLFARYVYPTLQAMRYIIRQARSDHLSVFYPPVFRFYRRLGPP